MFNGLVTTLLILALGLLGYDASLRTRVVKERAAVTAPAAGTDDMHTHGRRRRLPAIKP